MLSSHHHNRSLPSLLIPTTHSTARYILPLPFQWSLIKLSPQSLSSSFSVDEFNSLTLFPYPYPYRQGYRCISWVWITQQNNAYQSIPGDVINKKGTCGTSIIRSCNWSKWLLTSLQNLQILAQVKWQNIQNILKIWVVKKEINLLIYMYSVCSTSGVEGYDKYLHFLNYVLQIFKKHNGKYNFEDSYNKVSKGRYNVWNVWKRKKRNIFICKHLCWSSYNYNNEKQI